MKGTMMNRNSARQTSTDNMRPRPGRQIAGYQNETSSLVALVNFYGLKFLTRYLLLRTKGKLKLLCGKAKGVNGTNRKISTRNKYGKAGAQQVKIDCFLPDKFRGLPESPK